MNKPDHGPRDEPVPKLRSAFDELRAWHEKPPRHHATDAFRRALDEHNDRDWGGDGLLPTRPADGTRDGDGVWRGGRWHPDEPADDLAPARGFASALMITLAICLGICIGVIALKWWVPLLTKLPR